MLIYRTDIYIPYFLRSTYVRCSNPLDLTDTKIFTVQYDPTGRATAPRLPGTDTTTKVQPFV